MFVTKCSNWFCMVYWYRFLKCSLWPCQPRASTFALSSPPNSKSGISLISCSSSSASFFFSSLPCSVFHHLSKFSSAPSLRRVGKVRPCKAAALNLPQIAMKLYRTSAPNQACFLANWAQNFCCSKLKIWSFRSLSLLIIANTACLAWLVFQANYREPGTTLEKHGSRTIT